MNIVDRARALIVQTLSQKAENGQVPVQGPENTRSAAPGDKQTGLVDTPADQLRQAIQATQVWNDLERILFKIDLAFQRGEITREEAEALAQAATDKSRQIPASIEEMPLEDFATSGLVQEVKSKVLGETVIWAADNAQVPPETHQVVYRVCELRELGGMPAEWLQRLHVAKKTLNAKLIAAENDNEYEMIRV